jgi:hypothetical protein
VPLLFSGMDMAFPCPCQDGQPHQKTLVVLELGREDIDVDARRHTAWVPTCSENMSLDGREKYYTTLLVLDGGCLTLLCTACLLVGRVHSVCCNGGGANLPNNPIVPWASLDGNFRSGDADTASVEVSFDQEDLVKRDAGLAFS